MTRAFPSILALGLLVVASVPAQHGSEGAQVGQKVPEFELGTALMNGDGRTRMSQYFGRPLLIEFWGTQ